MMLLVPETRYMPSSRKPWDVACEFRIARLGGWRSPRSSMACKHLSTIIGTVVPSTSRRSTNGTPYAPLRTAREGRLLPPILTHDPCGLLSNSKAANSSCWPIDPRGTSDDTERPMRSGTCSWGNGERSSTDREKGRGWCQISFGSDGMRCASSTYKRRPQKCLAAETVVSRLLSLASIAPSVKPARLGG
jgi:hypothetical protein